MDNGCRISFGYICIYIDDFLIFSTDHMAIIESLNLQCKLMDVRYPEIVLGGDIKGVKYHEVNVLVMGCQALQ